MTYAQKEQRLAKIITIARELYAWPSDDNIEIDISPQTCMSDDGVWVQAWVHVSNAKIEEAGL